MRLDNCQILILIKESIDDLVLSFLMMIQIKKKNLYYIKINNIKN
jgi:hypothetical protein